MIRQSHPSGLSRDPFVKWDSSLQGRLVLNVRKPAIRKICVVKKANVLQGSQSVATLRLGASAAGCLETRGRAKWGALG